MFNLLRRKNIYCFLFFTLFFMCFFIQVESQAYSGIDSFKIDSEAVEVGQPIGFGQFFYHKANSWDFNAPNNRILHQAKQGQSFDSYFLRSTINLDRRIIETSVYLDRDSDFGSGPKNNNSILSGSRPGEYWGVGYEHLDWQLQEEGLISNLVVPLKTENRRYQYYSNYTYSFPNAQMFSSKEGEVDSAVVLNQFDYERAQYIGSVLSNSLNEAIRYMNPSGIRLTQEEYLALNYNLMEAFGSLGTPIMPNKTNFTPLHNLGNSRSYEVRVFPNNSAYETYPILTEILSNQYSGNTLSMFGKEDGSNSYSFSLQEIDIETGEKLREPSIFLFSLPKYTKEYINRSGGEIQAMSVQLLQLQALRDYYVFGRTSQIPLSEPSRIERDLMGIYENTLNGLRNILGLNSINDLVFNEGVRSNYYYGIFPREWVDNMSIYYIILNILAIVSLAAAVLKILFQQTFAIMNPGIKTSFMTSVQKTLMVIVLLIGFFPLFNILTRLNLSFTQIFAPVTPDMSMLSTTGSFNGLLSGLIVSTGFFVIMVIFNVIYILRAISIAILVVLAPICIASLAFGDSASNIFGTWIKELIANIFIQSLHVITFGLAFRFFANASVIESLVMLFAVIPITEMFRSIILGTGASNLSKMGLGAVGVAGGVAGSISNGFTKTRVGSSSGGGNSGSGGNKDGGGDGSGSSVGSSISRRSDTSKAINSKTTTPTGQVDSSNNPIHGNPQSTGKGIQTLDGIGGHAKSVGGALIDGASGAAKTGLGATAMIVTGGSVGKELTESGAGQFKRGAHGIKQATVGTLANSASLNSGINGDSSLIGSRRLDNGELQTTKSSSQLQNNGINKMYMSGENNANLSVEYNPDNLSGDDQGNLNSIVARFGDGTDTNARNELRDLGIENVSEINGGGYVVDYNATGMRQLGGIRNILNTQDGRVVETRERDSDVSHHPYTFRVPNQNP